MWNFSLPGSTIVTRNLISFDVKVELFEPNMIYIILKNVFYAQNTIWFEEGGSSQPVVSSVSGTHFLTMLILEDFQRKKYE